MDTALLLAALLLAFANGANDNFKGFATVWGSATLGYRKALWLASLATLAGCLASWLLAGELVQHFQGKGLVADEATRSPSFAAAVALGSATTVLLAARLGLPVSTTHALVGALLGAGAAQAGGVDPGRLLDTFLLPLLISPLLAALLGRAASQLARRHPLGRDCVCLDLEPAAIAAPAAVPSLSGMRAVVVIDEAEACARAQRPLRLALGHHLDRLHIASATAICLARGVNDTPKLAALLLTVPVTSEPRLAVACIAAAMLLGGVVFAQRVARTMSHGISGLDRESGIAANLVTASLVLVASKLGLPVSTTHVAVGAIGGVGADTGRLDRRALGTILLSWLLTLPAAATLAWSLARIG